MSRRGPDGLRASLLGVLFSTPDRRVCHLFTAAAEFSNPCARSTKWQPIRDAPAPSTTAQGRPYRRLPACRYRDHDAGGMSALLTRCRFEVVRDGCGLARSAGADDPERFADADKILFDGVFVRRQVLDRNGVARVARPLIAELISHLIDRS